MSKKIKFALEMKDGVKVRTLEELREHFDMKKVVAYFFDGKLQKWLEDRYCNQEAKAVYEIGQEDPEILQKLCQILGVVCAPEQEIDANYLLNIRKKQELLNQITEDEAILENAEKTAFNQRDIELLLQQGEKTIYLCGKTFTITILDTPITYIGILGKPQIQFTASRYEVLAAFAQKRILLKNVALPEIHSYDAIFSFSKE